MTILKKIIIKEREYKYMKNFKQSINKLIIENNGLIIM